MRYMKRWYYFSHVAENTNAQDVGMTASICEAFLHSLAEQTRFDRIRKIVLQSDQAQNYASNTLLFCLAHINRVTRLLDIPRPMLVRYVHTEVQEGHAECDRFFAVAGKVLRDGVMTEDNEGDLEKSDLNTGENAVHILGAAIQRGSLKNAAAELIHIDVERMCIMIKALQCQTKLKGLKMDTEFLGAPDFKFVSRECSGDLEYTQMQLTSEAQASRKGEHDNKSSRLAQGRTTLLEPTRCEGCLPFSGATRSDIFSSATTTTENREISTQSATENDVQHSESVADNGHESNHEERRDLLQYCVSRGVSTLSSGGSFIITPQDCHELLASLCAARHDESEVPDLAQRPAPGPEPNVSPAELEVMDWGDEQDEEDANEVGPEILPSAIDNDVLSGGSHEVDGDTACPNRPDPELDDDTDNVDDSDTPSDWKSFAAAHFSLGWARRVGTRGRKRRRPMADDSGEDEKATDFLDDMSLSERVRERLKEFYAEGVRDPANRETAGAALQRLKPFFLDFELPSATQVHTILCHIHSAACARKRKHARVEAATLPTDSEHRGATVNSQPAASSCRVPEAIAEFGRHSESEGCKQRIRDGEGAIVKSGHPVRERKKRAIAEAM